ncbi:MAG: acyl-CoA dehydrogenase family protein [Gemmataceae bacterium]|nr:acyl-CoA dehydrogenase family protein [Gemmataceae bacterium]MDW8264277.1 acyl-CoA dehydrogenase family protein [Gemmataceae bacterium]
MSSPAETDRSTSFAEAALRLGGKTEEEVRRTGAVDRADEQVEALFQRRYQTAQSPVHRAVWDRQVPLELFQPPPLPAEAACDAAMSRSLEVVRRRRDARSLLDPATGKLHPEVFAELAGAGYWGLLIDPRYGGQGAPFARFADFLTRMAVLDPMVAGLASVHGCIGAVDPVRTFGTPEQKARFLPRLASGQALSAFALTEPGAGSDLTALRTTAVLRGDTYEVTGEKLFITNAIPGRTIGLVVLIDSKPAVLIAELPPQETEEFQLVRYGLYALRHAWNHGLRFRGFRVPKANLLTPPVGDGLTIAYHGLNLGRVSLCATAAGSMRVMLANMLPWAEFRRTYGQPIATRELVKRRIARLAALIAGADALVAWTSWLIDEGYRGELECIVAKIFGSEAQKEAAIELFMKTHGGRSFLHGHLFGDNVHDFLAPCIYEGEGEMLGLAFFKSLVKEHGKAFFEPIGKAVQREQLQTFQPANPLHLWKLRRELLDYTRWSVGNHPWVRARTPRPKLPPKLAEHVDVALEQFRVAPWELSATMRKHQLRLADRQCRMAELSQRLQDTVVMLVTALWGARQQSQTAQMAADILCQDLRRKLTGERPSDRYFRDVGQLADAVLAGGFEALAGVPREEILMRYDP